MTITAVLNMYRRPANLPLQIASIRAQTLPPQEILLWDNSGAFEVRDDDIKQASCSDNLGVWARFAYALNATSDYVCVFDDDTIPGPRWFENCLQTMASKPALLGTVGIRYENPKPGSSYMDGLTRCGWVAPHAIPVEVDFVGHAWFFKREWLSAFWRELPEVRYRLCGEDMHFSYMLQKYLGIPTYVPPHPPGDKSLWGSIQGEVLGRDEHSLWESNPKNFREDMFQFFIEQRAKGWNLVHDR